MSPAGAQPITNEDGTVWAVFTGEIYNHGPVAPDVAHRVIADAAVFLSTSDEEGFPNTFLQAWAAGTPVVSLKIDPDHIIERHRLGNVSVTVDRAIDDTRMTSYERRDSISIRARKYVAEHHGASAIVPVIERSIRGTVHNFVVQSHTAEPV